MIVELYIFASRTVVETGSTIPRYERAGTPKIICDGMEDAVYTAEKYFRGIPLVWTPYERGTYVNVVTGGLHYTAVISPTDHQYSREVDYVLPTIFDGE